MGSKKTAPYKEGLHERLKDPEYATEYLNAHFAGDDKDALEGFQLALSDLEPVKLKKQIRLPENL